MLAAKTPVAIARASDFFGPRITNSLFGERLWKKLLSNSAIEVIGDVDQLHTYSYGPDVAEGLVTLGLAEADAFGKVWHLPALAAESTRTWIERFAKMVGRNARKTMRLTPFMARRRGALHSGSEGASRDDVPVGEPIHSRRLGFSHALRCAADSARRRDARYGRVLDFARTSRRLMVFVSLA